MIQTNLDDITAKNERDKLCEENFKLLHQISLKPECVKLLSLARNYLKVLSKYKENKAGENTLTIETFIFPLPPTLNEIVNTARSNRYSSANEKKIWTKTIASDCFGKTKFPDKVWIEFVWKIKSFRRDPDNISAAAKFIMDGLVEGGIIQDDSLKFIMSPVLHWYEKGGNLVQVRVADHPIWNGNHIDLMMGESSPYDSAELVRSRESRYS